MGEPVLCYVKEPWAYFTTKPLPEQWGDDWNDAPYEHNAGAPYEWHEGRIDEPYQIIKVAFYPTDIGYEEPDEYTRNSGYSVKMINAGAVPWLRTDRYSLSKHPMTCIFAGCTLHEFRLASQRLHLEIYERTEYDAEGGRRFQS